jgi:hypothetical protein
MLLLLWFKLILAFIYARGLDNDVDLSWWKIYNMLESNCSAPRHSSMPYIGHDIFVDHAQIKFPFKTSIDSLQTGAKIFLEAELIVDFANIVDEFKSSFVLITRSNRDAVIPFYRSNSGKDRYIAAMKILGNKYLSGWLASNVVFFHPKLIPLPLGSKWNWVSAEWHEEEHYKSTMVQILSKHTQSISANFRKTKQHLLLFDSMTPYTSDEATYTPWKGTRNTALKIAKERFIKTYTDQSAANNIYTCNDSSPYTPYPHADEWESYLLKLSRHKYTLSPPGKGPDCHRTWEALLMGSVPVVLSGPMNALYTDLPVLVLESWEDMTPALLEAYYQELLRGTYNFAKLFAPYWIELIDTYAAKHIT